MQTQMESPRDRMIGKAAAPGDLTVTDASKLSGIEREHLFNAQLGRDLTTLWRPEGAKLPPKNFLSGPDQQKSLKL